MKLDGQDFCPFIYLFSSAHKMRPWNYLRCHGVATILMKWNLPEDAAVESLTSHADCIVGGDIILTYYMYVLFGTQMPAGRTRG